MYSIEQLKNYVISRISQIDKKLRKANSKIVDGDTLEKRTAASVKKLKLRYGKTELCDLLNWVRELADVEVEKETRITELEDHRQEILNAISEADYEVL